MFFTLAVAGGAIPPVAPTISYGSLFNNGTQITATITNYNPEYGYAVTLSPGSFSRSASTINISGLTAGTSFNLLVIATTAKGLSAPSSAVTDRQAYTYRTETRTGTRFVDTTSCYVASPNEPRCPFGGTLNGAGTQCCIPSGYTEEYTYTVTIKNDTPAGYLDSGYDWYRVGNITVQRTPYTYYTETYTYTYPCSSTCCVDLPCQKPCQVPGTCYRDVRCNCCGDACVNGQCPPQDDWYCQNGRCCSPSCVCREAYPCQVPGSCPGTCQYCSPCTITCTGTGTRQVRNATPSGYLDSGVDWYRFV